MALPFDDAPLEKASEAGFIGRIPVQNIWLLMLYASDLLRQLPERRKIAVEENPDDIPDLVAEVLARTVEKKLQRNLTFGYQTCEASLSRVRGRIDFLKTERRQLMRRGLVACRFEEFTTVSYTHLTLPTKRIV